MAVLVIMGSAAGIYSGMVRWASASPPNPLTAAVAPVAAAAAILGAAVVWRWRPAMRVVGPLLLAFFFVASVLTAEAAIKLAHGTGDFSAALYGLGVWLPAVYLWSFVALGAQRGWMANVAFLALLNAMSWAHEFFVHGHALSSDEAGALMQLTAAGVLLNIVTARALHTYARFSRRVRERAALAVHSVDPKTGLSTLSGLVGENWQGESMAVVSVSLGEFTAIVAQYGHSFLDRLVIAARDRMDDQAGVGETVMRTGDDGLTVVRVGVASESEALAFGQDVATCLALPFVLEGHHVRARPSVGVVFSAGGGEGLEELVRRADEARMEASESPRTPVVAYRPEFSKKNARRVTIAAALADVDMDQEFSLNYQPILSFGPGSGQVVAFEALVRWTSARLGPVYPDEFIPVAESSGVIHDLGAWVLRHAMEQLRAWHDAGHPVQIGVNLSPVQVLHDGFLDSTADAVAGYRDLLSHVVLEVTEGVMVHGVDTARDRLEALRRMGFSLAIDDFGTGYSSLAYLRELPAQYFKIDRAFQSEIGGGGPGGRAAEQLVRGVVELGHGLGMRVIAEGVETAVQARFLASLGCDGMQGYLASRPVPAELAGGLFGLNPRALMAEASAEAADRSRSVPAPPEPARLGAGDA